MDIIIVESDSSNDAVEIGEVIDLTEEEAKDKEKAKKRTPLSAVSLDFNVSLTRTTRNDLRTRGCHRAQNSDETGQTGHSRHRMKLKDVNLRNGIEQQKKKESIRSEDEREQVVQRKRKQLANKTDEPKDDDEVILVDCEQKEENKYKMLLGNLRVDLERLLRFEEQSAGVRQMRKKKFEEEAKRKKLGENTDYLKDNQVTVEVGNDYAEKSESNKNKILFVKLERHDLETLKIKFKEEAKRRKIEKVTDKVKKKKKYIKRKKKDESSWWRSSRDLSSSEEEAEEEEGEEEEEEERYVSDHEFSPESDMDQGKGDKAVKLKRARTAFEVIDGLPCQKCGKSDHPERLLLCDSCDNGWHCFCLKPRLLRIPEGNWFCPLCQHASLLKRLRAKLYIYDMKLNKKKAQMRRKEYSRNAMVNFEDYKLRLRSRVHDYRCNDFNNLISSAVQNEARAVRAARRDIAAIVNAEKEQVMEKEVRMEGQLDPEPSVSANNTCKEAKPILEDDGGVQTKNTVNRKKRRKWTLDSSSEEEEEDGSDEDFNLYCM